MKNWKKSIVSILPIFLAVLLGFGAYYMPDVPQGIEPVEKFGIKESLLLAYGVWSWYWGLLLLWPSYVKMAKYEGDAIDAALMRIWQPIFWFPFYWCLSLAVGFLGGGLYKFIKYVISKPPNTQ